MFEHGFAIENKSVKVMENADGIRTSKPFDWRPPGELEQASWAARWIWLDSGRHPDWLTLSFSSRSNDKSGVAVFEKDFVVDGCGEFLMRFSANRKCRVFINGRIAAQGPSAPGGDYSLDEHVDWWYFDVLDVSNFITHEENKIRVEVAQGGVSADLSNGFGGLILELYDDAKRIVETNGSWRCAILRACSGENVYDARLAEGREWEHAVPVENQENWNLVPSKLPSMMEKEILPVKSGEFSLADGESRTVDFGRVFAGFTTLDIEGEEGTMLKIEYIEIPDKVHKEERYICGAGCRRFRAFNLNSIRYLRLSASGGKASRIKVGAVFSSYPVAWRGSFKCSDETLNSTWEMGRHATQICMQSYHLDSPLHQEELGCTGDYMIEAAVNYVCFGETALAAADIDRTARLLRQRNWKMFHTSYSLLWVVMLKEFYMYSGDLECVRRNRDVVEGLLDQFLAWRGENGLVTETPSFMFMDWLDLQGFELHHPPCVIGQGYMSSFLRWSLLEAAYLASELGDESWRKRLLEEAEALKVSFKKTLWNPTRGLFRDGMPFARKASSGTRFMPEDRDVETYTPHTNISAIIAEIVSGEDAKNLMCRVIDDESLIEPQPYFHHFTFLALEKTGLFEEYGFKLMARWRHMLDGGMNTWREAWNRGDWSHAWTSSPTLQLTRNVLGVKITKPGCAKLEVKPCLGPLAFAEGSIPLPQGIAHIRVERKPDGGIVKSVDFPKGCVASGVSI